MNIVKLSSFVRQMSSQETKNHYEFKTMQNIWSMQKKLIRIQLFSSEAVVKLKKVWKKFLSLGIKSEIFL